MPALGDPTWRDQMKTSGEADTQAFANGLQQQVIMVCRFAALLRVQRLTISTSFFGNEAPLRPAFSP